MSMAVGLIFLKLITYYLLLVDYFSRYPVVFQLKSTTSAIVINALKSKNFQDTVYPEIVEVTMAHKMLHWSLLNVLVHMTTGLTSGGRN